MRPLSRAPADPELEEFRRTIDLAEYAKKLGYEPRPSDVDEGLTFLEHPNRDRIVVARSSSGAWLYASVDDYEPRAPRESRESALERLRASIARAEDKGSIVEFVQRRDLAVESRAVGMEVVRQHLRAYQEVSVDALLEGLSRAAGQTARHPRAEPGSVSPSREPLAAIEVTESGAGTARASNPELGRRRYDWSPAAPLPPESEVEQRLRRWREAQLSVDQKLSRAAAPNEDLAASPSARAVAAPDKSLSPRLPDDKQVPKTDKNPIAKRRYDWTPVSEADAAMLRRLRDPNKNRGR